MFEFIECVGEIEFIECVLFCFFLWFFYCFFLVSPLSLLSLGLIKYNMQFLFLLFVHCLDLLICLAETLFLKAIMFLHTDRTQHGISNKKI